MVVQHNLTAINANRYLGINNNKLSKSLEKLASGYQINRAGDNAAGLAVSEKMRSQIAGMTQGVKNAQDGISMVQTYEGALTETHSILQRMKTLADQMANGSYDDPIDRTAAQQEFLQLNDELNQIADTDFNGVIVLNGGKMADGLEQVDGMFDYKNKASQVAEKNAAALADAQAKAQAKIDKAQKTYNNAKLVYDAAGPRDLSNNGNALQWNTVDNSKYDKADANVIFNEIKGTGGKSLEDLDVEEVNVTFTWDGTDKAWKATRAFYTDDTGVEQDATGLATIFETTTATYKGNNLNQINGGFDVKLKGGTASTANGSTTADTTHVLAGVVIDGSNLNDGDTVTLKFTNAVDGKIAPEEVAFTENTVINTTGLSNDTLTISLNPAISSDKMTAEVKQALDDLGNAEFSYSYSGTAVQNIQIENGGGLTVDARLDGGSFNVYYTDAEGHDAVLATITPAAGIQKSNLTLTPTAQTNTTGTNAQTVNVNKISVTYDGANWIDDDTGAEYDDTTYNNIGTNSNNSTVGASNFDLETKLGALTGMNKGDNIVITFGESSNKKNIEATVTTTSVPSTAGSVKFKVSSSYYEYNEAGVGPTIKASKDSQITTDTKSIDLAYADAKKALADAKAAYPKTLADLGEEYKVSVSDAFNKSEAKLTYKDNIALQAGARTKDLVNFTFTYDSTSIGDLKADLNCTAEGLGTSKLTLKTQEDANYAIDKIDQAINKVSLIRGTFGAIQNRLEHKIDNMNVSIENLTSAESQIRDTDMPKEMMEFTKNQILAQAAQSMLAQANQLPQGVLSLLQ